jgi:hypothetical protein
MANGMQRAGGPGLFQGGPDDFASQLCFAPFSFVDAVEHGAQIQPQGQPVQILGGQLQAVVIARRCWYSFEARAPKRPGVVRYKSP